jgi:hypothetical protein
MWNYSFVQCDSKIYEFYSQRLFLLEKVNCVKNINVPYDLGRHLYD